MPRNSAKAHWNLDEFGGTLTAPGDYTTWDGLARWMVDHLEAHPEPMADKYLGYCGNGVRSRQPRKLPTVT